MYIAESARSGKIVQLSDLALQLSDLALQSCAATRMLQACLLLSQPLSLQVLMCAHLCRARTVAPATTLPPICRSKVMPTRAHAQ
jgi:hypothetical protein